MLLYKTGNLSATCKAAFISFFIMYDFFDKNSSTKLNDMQNFFYKNEELCIESFEKLRFTEGQKKDPYFGYIGSRKWRRFLMLLYYADVLSYSKPEDRVDFPRLFYVVDAFPQGFTLWQARINKKTYPVGYSGWYYVEKDVFDQVAAMPYDAGIKITSRFFMPARRRTHFLYLFNYSIIGVLKHSQYSKLFMMHYAHELESTKWKGMFCASVSDDGIRGALRFGMKKVGDINAPCGLSSDSLYCCVR